MNVENQKVWLITGVSKGMGLHLTKLLLSLGHKVIGTTRNTDVLEKEITINKENLFPVKLDITSDAAVKKAIDAIIKKVGRIDVVVNNAGYSLVGSMEEMTDEEFRATIDVNLFGTVNIIRNVMPYLRKQESGHIINISSGSGFVGNGKAASYNAAKFGVVGLTYGLHKEVQDFGIKVTLVAPGQFRTEFMDSLQYVKNRVPVYGIDADEKNWSGQSGQQKGDPEKLVKILVELSELENPPLRLILGKDAYEGIIKNRKEEAKEFEDWKEISLSTDFE